MGLLVVCNQLEQGMLVAIEDILAFMVILEVCIVEPLEAIVMAFTLASASMPEVELAFLAIEATKLIIMELAVVRLEEFLLILVVLL